MPRNVATQNSSSDRSLQFAELKYIGAFATCNSLPKNKRTKFDRKFLLSHPVGGNYTTDDGLRYFFELVIFPVIPRSPRTNWANFPAVLILAFLNESVRSVRSNGRFPFRFARPFVFRLRVFS